MVENFISYYKNLLNEAEQNYYRSQFDLRSNSVKQMLHNLKSVASFAKSKVK